MWMKEQGMALEICMTIMSQLEQWSNDDTQSENSGDTFQEEQQQIGWDCMMDGWFT